MRAAVISAALALLLLWAGALPARAEEAPPRTATVLGAADPGVLFDLRELQVSLDPAAATLALSLRLELPLPQPSLPVAEAPSVTVRLAADALADGESCRIGPRASDGDVTVRLLADPLDGALSATATIAPDLLPRPLTVERAPLGTRLSLTLADPLLARAAPRCAEAVARGRGDAAQQQQGGADADGDDRIAGWFDDSRPQPVPDSRPTPPAPPVVEPPSAPPTAPPAASAPPATRGRATHGCRVAEPAVEWEPFPRELALRATTVVPMQARRGRQVSDLLASVTTFRDGRAVGAPVRTALPARGYALQLRAPAEPGRLEVVLSWSERRGGAACRARSRTIDVAVVRAQEPRLTITRDGDPARLTLAWGARGHDCHALAERPLSVRLEGYGYRRDYRVALPCDGWEEPGMALPDVAAQVVGETLRLTPRGDEPGSWRYRLTARSGRRAVADGTVIVRVLARGGELVRGIRFVPADAAATARRAGIAPRERAAGPRPARR